jgi:hypothetical protein
MKFRIVRNEQIVAENLKVSSLKKLKEDATEIEKG